MNPHSGTIHALDGLIKEGGPEPLLGQPISAEMLKERDEVDDAARARLEALQAELEAGETVVGVSDEVAHRQALGERELERRRGRRRTPPGPPDPPSPDAHRPVG